MGGKAAETTHNINNTFGPGPADECTVQWWFEKFCKRDEGLQDEEPSSQPWEVVNNHLRVVIEADPLIATQDFAKDLSVIHSMVVQHWKQIGKVKKLKKWMPHELTTNQKYHHFEVSHSLNLLNNNKSFLNWIVMYDESGFYNWRRQVQWLDWKEAPKHFPKPNLHQNKSHCHCGGLLLLWSTTVLWVPAKPLHLRSMLSKLVRCTKNCNTCRRHWSTEGAQFFSMATPDHMSHNLCFSRWMKWAGKFSLIRYVHLLSRQPTTTSLSILTTFHRGNASTSNGMHKTLSKSSLNPEAWIFMLQE